MARNKIPYASTGNPILKWIVLIISTIISAASIYYTDFLVDKLKAREIKSIELFAKSMEYQIKHGQLPPFIHDIIVGNHEIPLIYMNARDEIEDYRNIDINENWPEERKQKVLLAELEKMKEAYEPKHVFDKDGQTDEILDFWFIYYRNSFLLTQLTYYPIIQLTIIGIFGIVVYLIFSYSKTAEQNRVWVGLAKETAHQLGTPISSLMAWIEYFREDPDIKEKGVIEELDKDVKKLQLITERFSNIGSVPVLSEEHVESIIKNVVDYLKPRISTKVTIKILPARDNIKAKLNSQLFEWVLENLCKNAIDAMPEGAGNIQIKIDQGNENKVFIDVSDDGKGIPKSKIRQVFSPGFTTKKRGWGLGLTLAKRIVEVYHNGKIFVKNSEENQGTTFRIVLGA